MSESTIQETVAGRYRTVISAPSAGIKEACARKRFLYPFVKRTSDIVLSSAALLVLSPVFLAAAAAIRLEDGGPAIFVQERIGEKEEKFRIYKFRSMKVDADKIHEKLKLEYGEQDVSFKPKNDPRVTRVGKVIRKFNIDELPQLFNILKGDMSIVGPRPLPVYEYEEERKRYGNRYSSRYLVPQGLTCYWQIANRSEINFENRMQMDVKYAKECTLLTDVKLMLKTFLFTIAGKAGY